MNEKILIIAPDGRYMKKSYKLSEEEKFLRTYLEINDLTFPDYDKSKKDLISLYLAGISYIVMYSDTGNCFIYMGDKISKEQRKSLKRNKGLIKNRLIEAKFIDYGNDNNGNTGVVDYYHLGNNYLKLKQLLSNRKILEVDREKNKRKCHDV